MSLVVSTAREGVDVYPADPYSPNWTEFYQRNPGFRRSVGAAGNDGADSADGDGPDENAGSSDAQAPAEADASEESDDETSDQDDADEGNGEDGEAEEIEFDFGGNKLKVPKGSIPEEVAQQLDKFTKGTWADYTRKSQEHAERSKSLEARERAAEKLVTLNGEALQIYSRGLQVRDEIEQLSKVDLSSLWQSDADQARRVSDRLAQKQAEFQRIVAAVNTKETELTNAQQSEIARRMDEGRQQVERRIKGFKADDVVGYAVKAGIPESEAKAWALNPIVTEFAHKAMLYDRMQTAAKKPAPKAEAAEPVRSLKTKGTATAAKDPDKMSADEWLVWRNRQLQRKRG